MTRIHLNGGRWRPQAESETKLSYVTEEAEVIFNPLLGKNDNLASGADWHVWSTV